MKTPAILLLFLVAQFIPAIETNGQSTLKSFTLKVGGSSTLHEWESGVEKIEWKGSVSLNTNKILTLKDVEVKIPVSSIKSEHGKLMDGKTYEAFNVEKNPYILFKVKNVIQKPSGNDIALTLEGELTMNGVTNAMSLTVIGKSLPGGDMRFSGTRALKMSEFKMKQPTAMMGTIKVGDEVTVKYDLTISTISSL